jgi:hypothetical protein
MQRVLRVTRTIVRVLSDNAERSVLRKLRVRYAARMRAIFVQLA